MLTTNQARHCLIGDPGLAGGREHRGRQRHCGPTPAGAGGPAFARVPRPHLGLPTRAAHRRNQGRRIHPGRALCSWTPARPWVRAAVCPPFVRSASATPVLLTQDGLAASGAACERRPTDETLAPAPAPAPSPGRESKPAPLAPVVKVEPGEPAVRRRQAPTAPAVRFGFFLKKIAPARILLLCGRRPN